MFFRADSVLEKDTMDLPRFAVRQILALVLASTLVGGCDVTSESVSLATTEHAMGMSWDDPDEPDAHTPQIPAPEVTFLGETSASVMRSANRIAIAPDGVVVVTDPDGDAVHLFTPFGTLMRTISGLEQPLGCAVDGEGRIYIGDEGTRAVWIYDPQGTQVGILGSGLGEFIKPTDLAIDRVQGMIYVVDSKSHRVTRYGPSGVLLGSFGGRGSGPGELDFPTGIALDPDNDRVYVGDHGNHRIQVFDGEGQWIESMGPFSRVQGLALDHQHRLYVADAFQSHVVVLDAAGTRLSTLGGYGTDPGLMVLPTDVVVDEYGRLLVTSHGTGKVAVFGLDAYTEPTILEAVVTIEPRTLVVHSARQTPVSVFLALPQSPLDPIDPTTVRLQGELSPLLPKQLHDGSKFSIKHDGDATDDLKLHFSRSALIAALGLVKGSEVRTVTVSGQTLSGNPFQGEATVVLKNVKQGRMKHAEGDH